MATTFTIRLANRNIAVTAQYDSTKEFCKDYLHSAASVAQSPVQTLPDFSVTVTPADIAFEQERSTLETPAHTASAPYLETLALYRSICECMPEYNTFLFHCSALALDGKGYLFTAPSGTGKSTHARLWREVFGDRVIPVNDDKPLLTLERHDHNNPTVTVHGTPWDGKHRISTNTHVPVAGIALLERAAENCIERIAKGEAFSLLLQQTYRPLDPVALAKTLDLLSAMADAVPLYRLRCNMDPAAAETAFATMSNPSKGALS